MKRDQQRPDAGAGESARRIREGLRAELKKRKEQVPEVTAALGRKGDYLRRVAGGTRSITVDRFLETLHRMEIDLGRFFANALGGRLHRDELLADVERPGEVPPRLKRIEQATIRIEVADSAAPSPSPIDADKMLADFLGCTGTEQRRRLRHTAKYRHPAFAAAYLEHLDSLRYDDPKEARQNAEVVAVWLIPEMAAPRPERLALQLLAIGIYASAQRHKGEHATAARALRRALAVARAHGLEQPLADLLQRAAYVLSSHGRNADALDLLDEALVIYHDLDLPEELARVQVDRGVHRYYLGELRPAVRALEQALERLSGDSPRDCRNRLVAYQVLAYCLRGLDDLKGADVAIGRAVAESANAGRVYRASLLWDYGAIALSCEDYFLAEERLREASDLFNETEESNQALVALDLTKALIGQGKTLEAVAMATSMARYLKSFRGNKLAESTISELMRTALEGRMSLEAIDKARDDLQSASERQKAQIS